MNSAAPVPGRRRTSLGDTVTTRTYEALDGRICEDITVEVIPLADINKPGRVWPAQPARDVWSRP